jgi:hypothetical protein
MLLARQWRPTTHSLVPNWPTSASVEEIRRKDMEGQSDLAAMAPSWQHSAPLLPFTSVVAILWLLHALVHRDVKEGCSYLLASSNSASLFCKIIWTLSPAIKCSQAFQQKTKKYSEQQAAESMFMLVILGTQINEEQILVSTVYGNNGSNHYNRNPHMATYISSNGLGMRF